jgi:hypothetical protein
MKNGGWLDSYADGGTMQEHQENYNDASVSLPEGFVGDGYNTKGRNYSPAWGGQFENGGELIPIAQKGKKVKYVDSKNDPGYQAFRDSTALRTIQEQILNEYNKSRKPGYKFTPDKTSLSKLSSNEKSLYLENPKLKKLRQEQDEIVKRTGYKPIGQQTYTDEKMVNEFEGPGLIESLSSLFKPSPKETLKDVYSFRDDVYKKPQQQVIVKDNNAPQYKTIHTGEGEGRFELTQRPKLQAIQNNLQLQDFVRPNIELNADLSGLRPQAILPKSFDVTSQRHNMKGLSDYYNYDQQEVSLEKLIEIQEAADAYNEDLEKRYGPQNEYRTPKSAEKAAERLKILKHEVNATPNFQMGGSLPGASGMMYARQGAPSNGKYAKKTMASAQDGGNVEYDYVNYGTPEYKKAYEQGQFAELTNPLDEVVVTPYDKQFPYYQQLTPSEQKYLRENINSNDPISRQLKARAVDSRGLDADKASQFAKSWLLDLPLSSLQVPQSALVEGVEGIRGNDFNMLNAFIPGEQKVPSDVWGFETTDDMSWYNPRVVGNFAMDMVTDPMNVVGAGVADDILKLGLKQGLKNTAVKNVDDVGRGVTNTPKPWQMQELPGLHLKSTMEEGAISKIIEPKTGLINTEQALAIIGKESGGADKVALIRQGLGENIPKKMDYNDFRKTVQDQLIPLERQFATGRSDYGINNLGYNKGWSGDWGGSKIEVPNTMPIENQTLILGNKNKFGRGSSAHGNPDETLGHAHFLRDAESPNVLTVTQIQSDAFQGSHRIMPKSKEAAEFSYQRSLEHQENLKNIYKDARPKLESLDINGNPYWYELPDGTTIHKDAYFEVMRGQEEISNLQKKEIENFTQKSLLDKNHQERYLQELVDYAGKRGDVNKMRVPTSETAAKVQGYNPIQESTLGPITKKQLDESSTFEEFFTLKKEEIKEEIGDYELNSEEINTFKKIYNDYKAGKLGKVYDPAHTTILKKYEEQPKTIKKLFGKEPTIVTDSKGNTWYEFDIPDKFKKGKGEIKAFQVIGGMGAAGAATQLGQEETPQFQKGGIIKDNNGYWNPDNWGKPVEIDSNQITMKGVNQPLLGISDTGDTKLMKPGKNYKFKGKKVTEFPMAKNGLRQEQKGLQNLDNLTNFTNYNKPQPGGWLNKYN